MEYKTIAEAKAAIDNLDRYYFRAAKFAGWIAMYHGEKIEIKKEEANGIYAAKLLAIKYFCIPKSKQGLLVIAPAYEEVEASILPAPMNFEIYRKEKSPNTLIGHLQLRTICYIHTVISVHPAENGDKPYVIVA